jgi:hypothetical protein
MALAKTFMDDQQILVEIISLEPTSSGLVEVAWKRDGQPDRKFVRHVDRLEPVDDHAKRIKAKFRKKR